jgi:hypothetical protein
LKLKGAKVLIGSTQFWEITQNPCKTWGIPAETEMRRLRTILGAARPNLGFDRFSARYSESETNCHKAAHVAILENISKTLVKSRPNQTLNKSDRFENILTTADWRWTSINFQPGTLGDATTR